MALRHPNKHIQAVLEAAIRAGWRVEKSSGQAHAWGRLYCPHRSRDGCQYSILSTPRNPEDHAKQLLRAIRSCPHQLSDE